MVELVEEFGLLTGGSQLYEQLGSHQNVDVNQLSVHILKERSDDGHSSTSHQLLLVDGVVDDEVLEESQEAGDGILLQLPVREGAGGEELPLAGLVRRVRVGEGEVGAVQQTVAGQGRLQ